MGYVAVYYALSTLTRALLVYKHVIAINALLIYPETEGLEDLTEMSFSDSNTLAMYSLSRQTALNPHISLV